MIPTLIAEAIERNGWSVGIKHQGSRSGTIWVTLLHQDRGTIDIRYDRWRHTRARAYKGSALAAVLGSQREVIEYLAAT